MLALFLHYIFHSNWYRAPSDSWTERFNYVVGIIHTSKWLGAFRDLDAR